MRLNFHILERVYVSPPASVFLIHIPIPHPASIELASIKLRRKSRILIIKLPTLLIWGGSTVSLPTATSIKI